jgi:hypothetical protein
MKQVTFKTPIEDIPSSNMTYPGRVYSKELWKNIDKPMTLSIDIDRAARELKEMSLEDFRKFFEENKSEKLSEVMKKLAYETVRSIHA